MKTFNSTLRCAGLTIVFIMSGIIANFAQIQFAGYVNQGEGIAGWNADGSGPEPAGLGHQVPAPGFGNQYYYGSSHDYITGNPDHACAHFLPGSTGFPQFVQALTDHGYLMNQVKIKYGLSSLGDDLEGIDWFFFEHYSYSNYYDVFFTFDLDGQPFLAGFFDYANMYINTVYGDWQTETGYSPVYNVATNDTLMVLANAFLADLDGREIKIHYTSTYGAVFSGNGRSGAYYNVLDGELTAGNPELPFQGLNDDHEGFAGWDADGTGPEPFGNGHGTQAYYGASPDYDDIDPDPDACLGHFLEGSTGFFNTLIQLQYRGYDIDDLKIKMGLSSLGPDVSGEDWGYENGNSWCNYYNNDMVIEINGEPIVAILHDTNKLVSLPSKWISETGIGKLYDISGNATPDAQFVAQSLLLDVGTHYLKTITDNIQFGGTFFNENGRNGGLYEILEGSIMGVHEQATFIPEGTVSGVWDLEGSPYYVDGHLTIENGQMLMIEPGVKVAVRGPYHVNVNGSINAEGTAEHPVIFTHSNPNLWWDGIDIDNVPAGNDPIRFDHCLFSYAYAQGEPPLNSGGALAILYSDSVEVTNCVFEHNLADIQAPPWTPSGAAIAIFGSDPKVQKCTFRYNQAVDAAAIIIYSDAEPVVSNCLFHDNEASSDAGCIEFNSNGNGIIINNTFAHNSANVGGAIQLKTNSDPVFINNIFWGNDAETSGNQIQVEDAASRPGFYYCDIEGGQAEFGGVAFTGDYLFNLEENPLFLGESNDYPYMIEDMSPCKDMGTPDSSAWFMPEFLPETCLAGNPRIYNARIDIGACEYDPAIGLSDPLAVEQDILIFPNPAQDFVFIQYSLDKPADVIFSVMNTAGGLIYQYDAGRQENGDHLSSFTISDFTPGIYIIRISIGNVLITKKLVKLN